MIIAIQIACLLKLYHNSAYKSRSVRLFGSLAIKYGGFFRDVELFLIRLRAQNKGAWGDADFLFKAFTEVVHIKEAKLLRDLADGILIVREEQLLRALNAMPSAEGGGAFCS